MEVRHRYGDLTVIGEPFLTPRKGQRGKKIITSLSVNAVCVCGVIKQYLLYNLNDGRNKSCGCRMEKHGYSRNNKTGVRHPEYDIWYNIRYRCYNKNCPQYKNWGGRGITVCQRWQDSFMNFLEDMGPRPSKKHSLDRKNNDGNYEKSNCRWVTKDVQAKNCTTNVHYKHKGVVKIQADWARFFEITPGALINYLKTRSFRDAYFHYERRKEKLKKKNNKLLGFAGGDITAKQAAGIAFDFSELMGQ